MFMCFMIHASKDTGLEVLAGRGTIGILPIVSATASVISSLGIFVGPL